MQLYRFGKRISAQKYSRERLVLKRFFRADILIPLILLLISAALLGTAYRSTAFAEWYAQNVYPALVRIVGSAFGILPFSAGELIVYAIAITVVVFLIKLILCSRKRSRRRQLLRRAAMTLLWMLSIILFLFTIHCGINYHRVPFSEHMTLEVRPSSIEELAALEMELIEETNLLAEKVPVADDGTTRLSYSPKELSQRAATVMYSVGKMYPKLDGYYPQTKPVFFSKGMSLLDITGVYFPLTIEANINVDVPDYTVLATACHELSHLRGFMREDEANFIAYLACRESGDDEFHYSGNMLALIYVRNALYSVDQQMASDLYVLMSDRVKMDFRANSDYWKAFKGPVATVSQAVNNSYLKINSQSDGVKSYGRVVDLLLADYRTRHNLT